MFVYLTGFGALLLTGYAHSHGEHLQHSDGVRDLQADENAHKAFFLWLFAETGCVKAFELVDAFMRPLPFIAQSLLSTTFISVVPIFLIFALNSLFLSDPKTRDTFTYVLLSFALGGLLGDVFFHTMPHLAEGHSHDHHHHHSDGHSHDQ